MPLPTTPTGAPQQPAPPNPQNGPNNPYYNPFTYTYGAAIGNNGAVPNLAGANNSSISIVQSSPRQLLTMKQVQGDLTVVFTGEENGQYLNLEFAPERNITPFEQIHVQLLITGCLHKIVISRQQVMQCIRMHQLERHFKISVTS